MDDELLKELENLREENKILRDSLVEFRPDKPGDGEGEGEDSIKKALREIGGLVSAAADKAKEALSPGTEKLTEALSRQMGENPAPILLTAFGAGFLVGRGFNRR